MAYFPNGCSGEILDNQCAECPVGRHPDAPCPVLLAQITYNYDQFDEGKPNKIAEVLNTLISEDGICKMKPVIEAFVTNEPVRDPVIASIMPGMREWAKARGMR